MEKSIGKLLSEARHKKNIALQDIEEDIKIRVNYLRALEEDDYEVFPGEIYLVGFLKTYSQYLGLDANAILREYNQIRKKTKDESVDNHRKYLLKKIYRKEIKASQKIKFILVGALFIIFFSIVFYNQKKQTKSTNDDTFTYDMPVVPSADETKKMPEKITLEITGKIVTWMRIMGDGELIYEGLIKKNEVKRWEANDIFKIRIGNIHGLEMKFNAKPVDILSGQTQEVRELVLERN